MSRILAILLILLFSSCAGKKAVFFYPLGDGCQALTEHTLKTVPMDCLRQGSVAGGAAQKCILSTITDLCLKANLQKPHCVERCVKKAPDDFKLPF